MFKKILNWFIQALSREVKLKEGYIYDDGEIRIVMGKPTKKEKSELEKLEKRLEDY